MSKEVQDLVYRSGWGDYYFPVQFWTLDQAVEELCDASDEDEEVVRERYDGVQAIGLHWHSLDGDEIYECPNYDDDIGDEPEPCLGYVDCHVW